MSVQDISTMRSWHHHLPKSVVTWQQACLTCLLCVPVSFFQSLLQNTLWENVFRYLCVRAPSKKEKNKRHTCLCGAVSPPCQQLKALGRGVSNTVYKALSFCLVAPRVRHLYNKKCLRKLFTSPTFSLQMGLCSKDSLVGIFSTKLQQLQET